jgi:hypothetical protein
LVEELGHNSREDSLGNFGADIDAVISILKNLWLDDWYETVLLADRSVSGKGVGGLLDSNLGWKTVCWVNLENGSPLGESASHSVVFGASLTESIKTLGGGLLFGTSNNLKTSIDLNTAVDSSRSKELSELLLTINSGISDGLIVHDNTTDVFFKSWSSEKKFSVSLSIIVVVLNADSVESLTNGSGGLVGSEDSLTWGADLLSGFHEFIFEVT